MQGNGWIWKTLGLECSLRAFVQLFLGFKCGFHNFHMFGRTFKYVHEISAINVYVKCVQQEELFCFRF